MSSVVDFYNTAIQIPERQQRVSCCQKATNYLSKLISLPWTIRSAITGKLASATVITGKTMFHCMPNCIQTKYTDYCVNQAKKYVQKVKPVTGLINTISESSMGQLYKSVQENEAVKTALTVASWFYPQATEAFVDPQTAILKQTIVPLIQSALEFLALQTFDFAYGVGFDTAIGLTLNQPDVMATLGVAHESAEKKLRIIQMALLTYTYGPTIYKAGNLGLSLFDAHQEVAKLFSKDQHKLADQIAKKSGLQEITGEAILTAAIFLLSCKA